ncbi:hypothetical protein C8R45DRAFT_166476 [Mycena sanguinolenta]|nr:hypothetical protein C8R45DRAFT_166476 [Mycena sanguinolenta]
MEEEGWREVEAGGGRERGSCGTEESKRRRRSRTDLHWASNEKTLPGRRASRPKKKEKTENSEKRKQGNQELRVAPGICKGGGCGNKSGGSPVTVALKHAIRAVPVPICFFPRAYSSLYLPFLVPHSSTIKFKPAFAFASENPIHRLKILRFRDCKFEFRCMPASAHLNVTRKRQRCALAQRKSPGRTEWKNVFWNQIGRCVRDVKHKPVT